MIGTLQDVWESDVGHHRGRGRGEREWLCGHTGGPSPQLRRDATHAQTTYSASCCYTHPALPPPSLSLFPCPRRQGKAWCGAGTEHRAPQSLAWRCKGVCQSGAIDSSQAALHARGTGLKTDFFVRIEAGCAGGDAAKTLEIVLHHTPKFGIDRLVLSGCLQLKWIPVNLSETNDSHMAHTYYYYW